MKKAIILFISLLFIRPAFASELLVPSQYLTIQSAIDAADDGDSVIVEVGTYTENINLRGKAITLRSSNPDNWQTIQSTVIDGNKNASCVVFNSGETSSSVLEGFTLVDGAGTNVDYNNGQITGIAGGAIFCLDSSPVIRHCNIKGNGLGKSGGPPERGFRAKNVNFGGGIALIGNCRATIENCFIANNYSDYYGPGIFIRSSDPEQAVSKITNCTIANNSSIDLYASSDSYELDCRDMRPVISNTIIWNWDQPSLLIADPSLVTYCCVRETHIFESDNNGDMVPYVLAGTGGNINRYPLFTWPDDVASASDYHLKSDSPCINTGDPDYVDSNGTDIDGHPRVMAGRVDIGADETVPGITVTAPSAGDAWTSGTKQTIKWSTYDAGTVDIWLSQDSGDTRESIEKAAPDTGSYEWQIPDTVNSETCMIFVEPNIFYTNVVCTPGGLFTIRPYSPGPVVDSYWLSLGGDFQRTGLSENTGPQTGCIKWQFETEGAVTASVTIGPEGRVYVPCEDGKLYALDHNGSLAWSFDANSPLISAPSIGPDGTVYVGSQQGRLFAVDINGNLRWTHDTGGFIFSSPAVSENGDVYAGSQDGTLYALKPDGSLLWTFKTKGPGEVPTGSIFASPAIGSDGTIYIGGLYDPNLYALDPNNGGIKWTCTFDSHGWPFASPVVAGDGTIYQVLLYDTNLYAINPDGGTIKWSVDLADTNSGLFDPGYSTDFPDADGWSEPVLGPDGTIYVSFDDPYLRAIEPDGSIKWAMSLGTLGGFTLTVGNSGKIYAAGDDGCLYVVDPDGEEIARLQSNGWLNHPVIAADNTIIVADPRDNSMYITYESNKVYMITSQCPEE